jgi:hypothetical protein
MLRALAAAAPMQAIRDNRHRRPENVLITLRSYAAADATRVYPELFLRGNHAPSREQYVQGDTDAEIEFVHDTAPSKG